MKHNIKIQKVRVVIETPKGSSEKYTYEKDSGFFLLKKSSLQALVFPYDFGCIPGTKGEEEDL